jgi:hypothetical protein
MRWGGPASGPKNRGRFEGHVMSALVLDPTRISTSRADGTQRPPRHTGVAHLAGVEACAIPGLGQNTEHESAEHEGLRGDPPTNRSFVGNPPSYG